MSEATPTPVDAAADTRTGLTAAQVAERVADGRVNRVPDDPSRTTGQILKANVLTPVNAIVGVLLVLVVIADGIGPDMLFGFVIVANSVIGTVQELRARTALERLAVLNTPHATVIRDGVTSEHAIEEVVFAYSDVRHETVMHAASRALAVGADFTLLGPESTMLRATVPVISVCAARTGTGKSQVSRWISRRLRNRRLGDRGLRVAVIRHPMPYGDLAAQRVQRFATMDDVAAADATIEEREEYEPHIAAGTVVYAGVDYGAILDQARSHDPGFEDIAIAATAAAQR